MVSEQRNCLSLCAGIGGLELGLRILWPGLRTVCHVERETYPASVLCARMAEQALDQAVVADDLQSFDGRPWRGAIHCIAAGIPCQPFSVAGRRKGKADERWLGEDFLRIVDEIRPELIVMENVPGFLTGGLDAILGGLEEVEAGWRAEWGLFRADATVRSPHRRERFFLVAERVPNAIGNPVWDIPERGTGSAQAGDEGHTQLGDLGEAVADSLRMEWEQWPRRKRVREGGKEIYGGERLADSNRARWSQAAHNGGREVNSGREPSPQRKPMANPDRSGQQRQADRGLTGRVKSAGPSEGLADSDRRGRESERVEEYEGQQGASGDQPYGYGADGRFAWPPGPEDLDGWRDYIAAGGPAPSLPGLRRGIDGVPEELEYAKDRLRALGNAVIPIASAYAIAKLVERLRQ